MRSYKQMSEISTTDVETAQCVHIISQEVVNSTGFGSSKPRGKQDKRVRLPKIQRAQAVK